MIYTEQQAREIMQKALQYSKADECVVNLMGGTSGNIRYANNAVSTSGENSTTSLVVTSAFGKKTGIATINEFDDASLEKAVRRSEELAQLAPENPEYMPIMGPQKYAKSNAAGRYRCCTFGHPCRAVQTPFLVPRGCIGFFRAVCISSWRIRNA